ncbi:Ankyrin-1 [Araneus ventricosus]|uniref:Alpha-latrotoxin n=1 Tax=Araneus ventricosus TaxID=182803 RepID=A0A4Y2NMP8_ARAVE|nr:Ankyrin-1 [Araneus ventricosus]
MVEFLLSEGANPMLSDDESSTSLHFAALCGDAEMAEILLSEKAHIRIESEVILSAAELAVRENHLDVIKLLLQMNVIYVDARGKNGYTLLHTSAFYGSLDITRYLVSQGADINAKDEEERKPVHIAAEKGFKDMVEFYLEYNYLEDDETAALFLVAANNGNENVCELLLKRNPDVIRIHPSDATPMHFALLNGYKDVLRVLLHYGEYYNAHPTALLQATKDNDAASLLRKVEKLFTAVRNNEPSVVEDLLKEQSNSKYCLANAQCVRKETALHYASWKGYEEIVDMLLKYNANPNTRTKTGATPLHYAVKFSHFNVVKALLSNGAIYNAHSQGGNHPLYYATDREIRDFLLFLSNIFKEVEDNDLSVLENLRGKDEGSMRSLIRAKNQKGKTLIEVAYICGFSKTEELQNLFETDVEHDLRLAKKLVLESKYTESFLSYESVLERRVAMFGADSHPVLDVKFCLAEICQTQRNLDKALHLFREVHECRKNSLGQDHEKTLLGESCVAFLLLKQGKKHEVLRIFEAIHMKLKEKLKPDDLNMINFEMKFSEVLFKMQKFDEALEINKEVEQKCTQKEDDRYRIILADSRYNTANVLSSRGNRHEALILHEKVYETRKNILTIHHSSTLKSLTQLASVLYLQKKYDESLDMYRTVLDIQKSHLPVDCIDMLETEFRVGKVLYSQKMHLAALKICLSLEPKIAVVAPNSGLFKENKDQIENIRYDLSLYGFQFMYDAIRDKLNITS